MVQLLDFSKIGIWTREQKYSRMMNSQHSFFIYISQKERLEEFLEKLLDNIWRERIHNVLHVKYMSL